jgi:hypothetical protein
VEAMPATVAITAMAMPTNIPKSTRRGRSTWANIACFVSGISRINAGDVDKRYLPMNALHTGCADRVRASDRPIRGGQNWRIYTSGWEYGRLLTRSYRRRVKFGGAAC